MVSLHWHEENQSDFVEKSFRKELDGINTKLKFAMATQILAKSGKSL